jgi:hypothetical protein
MMELQEQIERLSREKEKVVKEKSVMKTEISELYAQIEILQSEKVSIKKVRIKNFVNIVSEFEKYCLFFLFQTPSILYKDRIALLEILKVFSCYSIQYISDGACSCK